MTDCYSVRLEPVGVEMDVMADETVLEAAFRQGIAVMHGCKEGQCASCKAILLDGDIELKKYSTFALNETEREQDHILLCRTLAYSDLEIELLNYDEELLSSSIPVKEYGAKVSDIQQLTHDIRLLEVKLDAPLKFWAGQYVDITIPGSDGEPAVTRSFSMANPPSEPVRLQFIIKKYPEGAFSSRLDGTLKVGDVLSLRGPFGTCFRREERTGPMILVGGGSGMSPLLSMLRDQLESGETRPIHFFYGARTADDLFYLDDFAEIAAREPEFNFIPALSHAGDNGSWSGERGFIHEVAQRHLSQLDLDETADAYTCGPPPMIDAVIPVLQISGVDSDRILFDRFTQASH